MVWRNWEDWAYALTVAVALMSVLAFKEIRTPSFVAAAIAGQPGAPAYTITVTAKRLPAECKGTADDAMPAHCTALRDATAVTVKANP